MTDHSFWLSDQRVRSCPLCGSDRHLLVSTKMHHELDLRTVVCADCSFVFSNPMPGPETYERFYAEGYSKYYGHTAPALNGAALVEEPEFICRKLDRIERFLKLKGRRLLEISSGQGLFLWWARKRGCDVMGTEGTREFCPALAEAQLPYRHRLLLQIDPAEVGDFDVVVMSDALEHFYNPDEALAHCRRLLDRGGLLVVEVPNILKPFRSLDRYFLRYVHPSSFSPATLTAFLERHEFKVEFIDQGGSDWRTPQNIFVIARKEAKISQPCRLPVQKAEEVLSILNLYRRSWNFRLAALWMTREAWLRTRKRVINQLGPVKRELSSFRFARSAVRM